MTPSRRPDEGVPLWVALVLIAIFGAAMFLSGYVVGQLFG